MMKKTEIFSIFSRFEENCCLAMANKGYNTLLEDSVQSVFAKNRFYPGRYDNQHNVH
jgi:hypothetical protein